MTRGVTPRIVDKHKEIIDAYNRGKGVSEIRDMFGYTSNHSVIYVLRKYGVYKVKEKKGAKKKMDVPKVRALLKAHWTQEMVMEEFDYDYTWEEIEEAIKQYDKIHQGRRTDSQTENGD